MNPLSTSLPVRRHRVLMGLAVGLVAFAGIIVLTDALRHPPSGSAEVGETDIDPRRLPGCPQGQPREDREGRPAIIRPVGPPVAVGSAELLNCPESYDQRTVRYRGEAVGGTLARDHRTWVHLNDDVYSGAVEAVARHRAYSGANTGIGVLVPADQAAAITTIGGPRTRGDLVEVVGVFRRVDRSTQEVAVVHADSLEVIRPGAPRPDPPLRARQVAAGVLAFLAAATVIAERVVARRRARA